MARLTADDMIDIVRDCLGGETTETISDTRILRYINQSYLELSSEYQFRQLSTSTTVTTSSGTAAYELSVSNVLSFEDIVDGTNDVLLHRISEWQYLKYTQGGTTSGVPAYWFISGVGSNNRYELTLWPTPAGTYSLTVYYNQSPDELVTSPTATSAVIPEPWDDSIIYRAVARGWMQLGDPDIASKWIGMARKNDNSAMKSTYEPSYVSVRPGSPIGRALRDV